MSKPTKKPDNSNPIPKSAIRNPQSEIMVPEEVIMGKIYLIRGHKVMLDMDLAELYGVETKKLKQAVRRNLERFPDDFMFELNKQEFINLRSQIVTSNRGGSRYLPMAFTEQGVAMLSSVLNSKYAILVNIRVIRIFSKMREMLLAHKDVLEKLYQLERGQKDHESKILLIFEYLRQLEQVKQQEKEFSERRRIGFKND
jgi:hypothetical protein